MAEGSRLKVGRTRPIADPGIRDSVDQLFSMFQELKLNSTNLDLDEIARTLGRHFRDGQLEPVNRLFTAQNTGERLHLIEQDGLVALRVQQTSLAANQFPLAIFNRGVDGDLPGASASTKSVFLIRQNLIGDPAAHFKTQDDLALLLQNDGVLSHNGVARFIGNGDVSIPVLECIQTGLGMCLRLTATAAPKLDSSFHSRSNSQANVAGNNFEETNTGRVAVFQRTIASTNDMVDILQPLGSGRYISTDAGSPGAFLSSSGIWTDGCGIAGKVDRRPLRGTEVLKRVAKLKIWKWRSRREWTDEHIGPCREDVKNLFGLPEVSGYDLGGIALRSVQALWEEVKVLRQKVKALERQNGH